MTTLPSAPKRGFRIFFMHKLAIILMTLGLMGANAMAQDLKIEILQEGNGAVAEDGKEMTMHYRGTLEDSTQFDASYDRNQPFKFVLGAGQVIQGWDQGIKGMKVGEKRRLTIPSHLGYGAAGAGGVIPPNATLIFEVELLDVSDPVQLMNLTPDELSEKQKQGVALIDIRRAEEWKETGILEGADTVTVFTEAGGIHPDFQNKFMTKYSPEQEIIIYCRTGSRTGYLGNALIQQLGFKNVSHLTNGIVGWKKDNKPVVAYQ